VSPLHYIHGIFYLLIFPPAPFRWIRLSISCGWTLCYNCDKMDCCCVVMIGYKCWFTNVIGFCRWRMLVFLVFIIGTWNPIPSLSWHKFRCVERKFSNGTPLVHGCKASSHISRFILSLLLLGPVSNTWGCLFKSYKSCKYVFHVWRSRYQKLC
jgi:hypothetical protein